MFWSFGVLESVREANSRSRCRKNVLEKTFGGKSFGREIGLDIPTKIILVG